MAWIIFEISINCFQAYVLTCFSEKCFSYKKKNKFHFCVLFTICTLFLTMFTFMKMPPIDSMIFLFPIMFALLFSDDNIFCILYWNILVALIFSLVAGFSNQIYSLFLELIDIPFEKKGIYYILYILCSNGLIYALVHLIMHQNIYGNFLNIKTYALFFAMILSVFLSEESLYYYNELATVKKENILSILLIIAHVGLTSCVFLAVSLFHLVQQSALKESMNQAKFSLLSQEKQHQEELINIYSDLIRYRHDMKHHLQILREIVNSSENDDAQKYLNELENCSLFNKYIATGNRAVDAVLSTKFILMKSHGIEFKYESCPLSEIPISSVDFCLVIANLLDNAIEGIIRIPKYDEKNAIIRMSFFRNGQMLYIECENPCNIGTLMIKNGKFISSKLIKGKEEIHGIGLQSIEKIVSNAEGRMKINIEDAVFYIRIVLPFLKEGEYT